MNKMNKMAIKPLGSRPYKRLAVGPSSQ